MARLPEGDLATRQIFDIIRSYTTALDLLDDYDNQTIGRPQGTEGSYVLDYDECRDVIASMRFGNESSLFGVEKDDSFRASIGDIYAGFAGQEAYPTVEEKAANLLLVFPAEGVLRVRGRPRNVPAGLEPQVPPSSTNATEGRVKLSCSGVLQ